MCVRERERKKEAKRLRECLKRKGVWVSEREGMSERERGKRGGKRERERGREREKERERERSERGGRWWGGGGGGGGGRESQRMQRTKRMRESWTMANRNIERGGDGERERERVEKKTK